MSKKETIISYFEKMDINMRRKKENGCEIRGKLRQILVKSLRNMRSIFITTLFTTQRHYL